MSFITFEEVKFKNFLSYGDHIENNVYDLNNGSMTLIVGQNGAGKSTMLDALCFALYGKPFRDIKKDQIINSVNGKKCLVILKFSINNFKYEVRRGIKPNVFEIYRNNELIDPPASVKLYQEILDDIIGVDYQTFTNMICIGSSGYDSFMELPTPQRRGIVSKILDIEIFNFMSDVLKGNTATTKQNITENSKEESMVTVSCNHLKSDIEDLKTDDNSSDLESSLKEEKKEFKTIFKDFNDKQEEVNEAQNNLVDSLLLEKELEKRDNNKEISALANNNLKTYKTEAEFYMKNDNCNSCGQDIDKEFKKNKISSIQKSAKEEMNKSKEMSKELEVLNNSIEEKQNAIREVSLLQQNLKNAKANLVSKKSNIEKLEKLLEDSKSNNDDKILEKENKLKETNKELKKLEKISNELQEEVTILEMIKVFLKDNGIKAQIIKQWLPTLNLEINKILDLLNAHYSFELDEQFNETIKSRYRDKFSYSSFSQGEKARIDTAILFAFREIAKKKATVNCNLLIMDEILDGSLDAEANEILLGLLSEQDLSIFIVSHKIEASNHFPRIIEIEKKGNFSQIKE